MPVSAIESFTPSIADEALDDLRRRLAAARWPEAETVGDWTQGVPLDYCRELADYWANAYDWRRCETRLNRWDNLRVRIGEGDDALAIHCLHRRSPVENALPLVLTHGWPGSVFEFFEVIDALADPEAHGGRVEDAFHVVVPALPGYGFSDKPRQPGARVERIADLWCELMQGLGYPRFVAQGGDWGSAVTCALAQRHAAHCAGIHLNMIIAAPDPDTLSDPSPLEQAALAAMQQYRDWGSGYSTQQATRPQTLGYALADSPIGQLAWIIEKFHYWTDCERDGQRHPENAVSRDAMLDTVSLYWLTNSAASSARLYWESFRNTNLEPIETPVACSLFPKDIFLASERWARRRFPNLVYWNELEHGGHFAALEQPELFVQELRAGFRILRN